MSTTPAGVVTTVSSRSTVAVGTTTVTSVENSASSIANGALLLPQFATGGGWASQIVIANTSTTNQMVRVDVFKSSGSPLILPFTSSLSTVLVSAGGVVAFSTTP